MSFFFELTLLATIRSLGLKSWGSKLQAELSKILSRDVAIGQLYLALTKLERKGMISFVQTNPEPVRGGRSKKVFHLEASGVQALENIAAIAKAPGVLIHKENPSEYGKSFAEITT